MDIFFNIILFLGCGGIVISVFAIFLYASGFTEWLRNKYITIRMNKYKHPFLWWNEIFNSGYYSTYDVDKHYFQLNNGKWVTNDFVTRIGRNPYLFHNNILATQIRYVAIKYKKDKDVFQNYIDKIFKREKRSLGTFISTNEDMKNIS